MDLAQTDRLRCHFHQFVVLDIGQRLFQCHADRRGQAHGLVLAGSADVGQLLALQHVDFKIVFAVMLADDHALIDLPAGLDHHRAAVFEVPQRIGHGFTRFIGNQHTVAAALNIALVRRIGMEQAVHDRGATGIGQQFAEIADQTTGRGVKHQTQAIAARRTHFDHFGAAFGHFLHDNAGMFFIHVDHDFFDRLQHLVGRFVA